MAQVANVHGQEVVVLVMPEMLVANADHEELHVRHWNCLCFVPIQPCPYFSCFSEIIDCHVSHGFAMIGCLWSKEILDQIQKPLLPVCESVDFCSWDCFLYFHLHSVGPNHRESKHLCLGRVQFHLPSFKKRNC